MGLVLLTCMSGMTFIANLISLHFYGIDQILSRYLNLGDRIHFFSHRKVDEFSF